MAPTPIALIVFGELDIKGMEFLKRYKDGLVDCTRPLDIRHYLYGEPSAAKSYRCGPWQLGYSDEVQSNLLNQPRIVDAVKAICDRVRQAVDEAVSNEKPVKLVPIFCTAGRHRSSGSAYMAEKRVLNNITHNGSRVFNINTFILTGCRYVADVIRLAEEWARNPWVLISGDNEFGCSAVSTSMCARRAWDKIGALRKEMMALRPRELALLPPPPPPPRFALLASGSKRAWSSFALQMPSGKRARPTPMNNFKAEQAEPKVSAHAEVVELGGDDPVDGCSMIMCPCCRGSGTTRKVFSSMFFFRRGRTVARRRGESASAFEP